jgi:hypothetical protein
MAEHYRIVIDVAYDKNTTPKQGMVEDLRRGIDAAVQDGLLNDADALVIIEEYNVTVEKKR